MSVFKQLTARDIHRTFLNLNEFADIHNVNGRDMPVVIDYNENVEREKRFSDHIEGMFRTAFVMYVAVRDYGGPLPRYDSNVLLDGEKYRVEAATKEGGMYAITLMANRGRGRSWLETLVFGSS